MSPEVAQDVLWREYNGAMTAISQNDATITRLQVQINGLSNEILRIRQINNKITNDAAPIKAMLKELSA